MAEVDTGILLANLGSPTAPTTSAVRKFLKDFLGDPRVVNLPRPLWWLILHGIILPFRPAKSAHAYQAIWNAERGSPLSFLTHDVTELLRTEQQASNVVVSYAMRYGEPSIATQLRHFKALKVKQVIVLPLYPQYSSTTTASIYDDLVKELNRWRHIPTFKFISDYHDNPAYIAAVADQIQQHWQAHGRNKILLMSFHGLPKQLVTWGDPYYHQCQRTAQLIADALQLTPSEWQLVFQSRFGKAEWLKPYCVETLQALPGQGITSVDMVCPGFAVDCLETLEEIAITNRELFLSAGGQAYCYIPALNASLAHVNVLKNVLELS